MPDPKDSGSEEARANFAYAVPAHGKRNQILVWGISVGFVLAILAIFGALAGRVAIRDASGVSETIVWLTLCLSVAVFLSATVGSYLVRSGYWTSRLRRIERRQPDSLAFFTRLAPGVLDALDLPRTGLDRLEYRAKQALVTVGDGAVRFWSASGRPLATVDITEVEAARAGWLTIPRGRIQLHARTLYFTRHALDVRSQLPVPLVGPRGLIYADAADANRMIDDLSKALALRITEGPRPDFRRGSRRSFVP